MEGSSDVLHKGPVIGTEQGEVRSAEKKAQEAAVRKVQNFVESRLLQSQENVEESPLHPPFQSRF